MTNELEIKSGITSRSLAIGLIYVIVFSLVASYNSGFVPGWGYQYPARTLGDQAGYNLWEILVTVIQKWTWWSFLGLGLLALLRKAGIRFSRQEFSVVAMMIIVATAVCIQPWGILSLIGISANAYMRGDPYLTDWNTYIGSSPTWNLWGPPTTQANVDTIYEGFFYGESIVPWGAWAPAIAFLLAFFLVIYFWMLFTAGMLRFIYSELERLPFPATTAMLEIINAGTEAEGTPFLFKHKWLLIGLGLGFLGTLPFLRGPLQLGVNLELTYDLTFFALAPWVPLLLDLNLGNWGWHLLLPRDVLISGIIGQIVLAWILPALFYYMGALREPNYAGGYRGFANNWFVGRAGNQAWVPNGCFAFFTLGALATYGLIPLLRHRNQILAWLKGTAGRDRSLSPKITVLGMVACWLILIGMMVGAGFPAVSVVLITIITWILYVAMQRWSGATGGTQMGSWYYTEGYSWPIIIGFASTAGLFGMDTADQGVMSIIFMGMMFAWLMVGEYGNGPQGLAGNVAIFGYDMAYKVKQKAKDVFIAIGLAAVVSAVVTLISQLVFAYQFGFLARWAPSSIASEGAQFIFCALRSADNRYMVTWPFAVESIYWLVAGVIMVVGLEFISRMYPRLPLNPGGFLLAAIAYNATRMLLPMTVALIVRTIMIRRGGVGIYKNLIVPIAVGLIIGWGLNFWLAPAIVSITTMMGVRG